MFEDITAEVEQAATLLLAELGYRAPLAVREMALESDDPERMRFYAGVSIVIERRMRDRLAQVSAKRQTKSAVATYPRCSRQAQITTK